MMRILLYKFAVIRGILLKSRRTNSNQGSDLFLAGVEENDIVGDGFPTRYARSEIADTMKLSAHNIPSIFPISFPALNRLGNGLENLSSLIVQRLQETPKTLKRLNQNLVETHFTLSLTKSESEQQSKDHFNCRASSGHNRSTSRSTSKNGTQIGGLRALHSRSNSKNTINSLNIASTTPEEF